jgi:hypothetical protein
MVVPRSAAGTTSWRSRSIRSEVSFDCGEVVGITWTMPILEPGGIGGAATLATPLRWPTSPTSRPSACWSAGAGVWATSWSGPLKPGPNPLASRSYACRVVVEDGLLPASEEPRRRENTGNVRTPMSTIATADSSPGRRWTTLAQRCHTPPLLGVPAAVRRRSRRLSVRIPRMPSRAGSRVIAASTVATTVVAEAMAMPFRKLMPSTSMPSRAITTVAPANSTARPEVSIALTTESSTVMPDLRPVRCLVTMNRA